MAAMYLLIATDIAQRIINEEFIVGSRIAGRTLLASYYNVSSETIRKAVALLKEANIVTVSQGKEVTVLSIVEAYRFIDHHKSMESVYSLRQELEILLEQKNALDKKLECVLNDIIGFSDRLKNLSPYNPMEIKIPEYSHLVGRTIADIKLWQHTGATVIAIRRQTDMMMSPGPLAVIMANDKLVIVGSAEVLQRSLEFADRCAPPLEEVRKASE